MEDEKEKKYVYPRSEELQEIFNEVMERTGEDEKTVRKVLYNAANYIRDGLQDIERPEVMWNGLLKFRLMPSRVRRYIEKIEGRVEDPRPEDEKNLAYYKGILDIINKYKDGSWKEK